MTTHGRLDPRHFKEHRTPWSAVMASPFLRRGGMVIKIRFKPAESAYLPREMDRRLRKLLTCGQEGRPLCRRKHPREDKPRRPQPLQLVASCDQRFRHRDCLRGSVGQIAKTQWLQFVIEAIKLMQSPSQGQRALWGGEGGWVVSAMRFQFVI